MAMQLPKNKRYDDISVRGPVIISRHVDGQPIAIDMGITWYASDAFTLCSNLNAHSAGVSYHFRPLYDTAIGQE
jgi:hypothetical protein